jgi:hypothetical protein
MRGVSRRWTLAIAATVLVAAVAVTLVILRSRGQPLTQVAAPTPSPAMTSASQPGFTLTYPGGWRAEAVSGPGTDVVFLVRDPNPVGPIVPGLIVRRTANDPFPIDQDLPGVLTANQFQHPGATVLREQHVTITGGKEGAVIVSSFQVSGVGERIADIVVRTPANIAYHLQAVAPAAVLTDGAIDAMVAGFSVS